MEISATAAAAGATEADTIAVGVFEGEELGEAAAPERSGLLASGEAGSSFKALALAHASGKRWLAVGLGKRESFSAERARIAAAAVRERAAELSTETLCWQLPVDGESELVAALVEGTILTEYRFTQYKSADAAEGDDGRPEHLAALIVSCADDLSAQVAAAALVPEAVNAARD